MDTTTPAADPPRKQPPNSNTTKPPTQLQLRPSPSPPSLPPPPPPPQLQLQLRPSPSPPPPPPLPPPPRQQPPISHNSKPLPHLQLKPLPSQPPGPPPPPPRKQPPVSYTAKSPAQLQLKPPSSSSPQRHHPTHHVIPLPSPRDIVRYPLASSGRGLFPPGPAQPTLPQFPNSRTHPTTSNSSLPPLSVSAAAVTAAITAATAPRFSNIHHPLPKVGSSTYTVPEINAPKDLMDKKSDDLLVTLRDRKVRISEGASLYALCRSWLRNGYPEDNQPQHGDVFKSLPKPMPLPESSSSKRKEREDAKDFDEVESDGNLNAEELLARHVNRAKRVRARLREERSKRIERYKSRLAALLPPNGTIQE